MIIILILLCIMLAYLMLFNALSNVICLHNTSSFVSANFSIDLCIAIIEKYSLFSSFVSGLFTHILFISITILYHVQCF